MSPDPSGPPVFCIVDPSPGLMSERTGLLADVLASHPPIAQRITRLRDMGYLGAAPAPDDAREVRQVGG